MWQSNNLNSSKYGSKPVLLTLYHFIQRTQFHQLCFSSPTQSIFICIYSIPGTVSSSGGPKDRLNINHHCRISSLQEQMYHDNQPNVSAVYFSLPSQSHAGLGGICSHKNQASGSFHCVVPLYQSPFPPAVQTREREPRIPQRNSNGHPWMWQTSLPTLVLAGRTRTSTVVTIQVTSGYVSAIEVTRKQRRKCPVP